MWILDGGDWPSPSSPGKLLHHSHSSLRKQKVLVPLRGTRTEKTISAVPPCLPQKLRPLSEARMPGIRGPGPVTGAAVGGYRAGCAGRSPPPSANHLSGCFPPGFQLLRALCGGMARFYFRVSGLDDARSMAHIAYRYSSTSGGVCQGQGLAAAMRLCYIYLYH